MGVRYDFFWVEPVLQRPAAPDAGDSGSGIDEHPVHVEQKCSTVKLGHRIRARSSRRGRAHFARNAAPDILNANTGTTADKVLERRLSLTLVGECRKSDESHLARYLPSPYLLLTGVT